MVLWGNTYICCGVISSFFIKMSIPFKEYQVWKFSQALKLGQGLWTTKLGTLPTAFWYSILDKLNRQSKVLVDLPSILLPKIMGHVNYLKSSHD